MKNLFIIGNGFDIAHGFKTQYSCFKEWIENLLDDPSPTDTLPLGYFIKDRDDETNYKTGLCFLKELFDNNIALDYRWNTFEDSLSKLPIASKFESIVSEVLEPGEAFENPSRYDDVCVNNATLILDAMTKIPDYFSDWIKSVDIGTPCGKVKISDHFSSDALFINFNYTETLESIYGISRHQICYIHGSRQNIMDRLIIGHSDETHEIDNDFDCPSVKSILEDAIRLLRKDPKSNISINSSFLRNVNENITDIYTFGFAFGKQDLPYIADVIQRTGGKAKWHLSDFDDENTRKEIARLLKSYNQFGEISPFDHRLIL
ncbi:MAG: bacteriophage abortive infection AbiH family protein [Clostridiales bacterium]|nr:bacteriophage abortive infection AbiH family protein [Clostridiales bacterium]